MLTRIREQNSKKKLIQLAKDPKVDLWAQDEVHFQQYGSRCRMWIPPEVKRPVLFHHPTRKSIGYFGAVRLRDGKLYFQREDNSFNAETFFIFIQQLKRKTIKSGRKIVLLLDNAKFHHARFHKEWRWQNERGFQLLFLPPYSPDLNPIERLWKLTRRLCIHNRYFPELQGVVDSVESQFGLWSKPNKTLNRLCAII